MATILAVTAIGGLVVWWTSKPKYKTGGKRHSFIDNDIFDYYTGDDE